MNRLTQARLPVLLALLLAALCACRKSGVDPAVAEAVSKLPGSTNVWMAIDKNDYPGAIAALVKVQQAIKPEQSEDFHVLMVKTRSRLGEIGLTNAAAAEAANALRAMTGQIR